MWEWLHSTHPPTHCRKTKGGAGVRTRILTGISQVAAALYGRPWTGMPSCAWKGLEGEVRLVQVDPPPPFETKSAKGV